MLRHGLGLVVEAAVAEGGNEITDGLALDTDVWGEDIVTDGDLAGYNDHIIAMEEGWQGAAEFAHVDDDARG